MKNSILFIVFFLSMCNVYAQNLRFSYEVVNPLADQTKLIIKVTKLGGGTEPMAGFNFGFYYRSTEATIEGQAPGFSGTLNTTGMNACIDYSYATALGWDASPGTSTGTVIANPDLPAGVPSVYDRLFIGQLIDGNGPGTEFGSTPTNIIALTLDNSVGPGANDQDSVYQCASDNIPEWAYTTESFDEYPIIVQGTRLQPLPIELIAFHAEKSGKHDVFLTWSTATEINSSHFLIQRSYDKKTWANVGKLDAAGNSQIIENYNFLDANAYNGIDVNVNVYYRLQMFDLDGRSKFSPFEKVIFSTDASRASSLQVSVYPNPATNGVYVGWSNQLDMQPTSIEMYDVSGKLILMHKVPELSAKEYVDFGSAKIQSGVYQLRLMNGDDTIDYQQIVVSQNR